MFPLSILLFKGAKKAAEEQNFIDVIKAGGPISIAIFSVLLVLSFLAVYIFIERWLAINRAGKVDKNFMNNIRAAVVSGNLEGAKALCTTTNTPIARMVNKGLNRIGKPLRDIDAAIENVGNLEIFKLEKGLSTLASIAGAAPMIGFFGTVTGMIMAFQTMATAENVGPAQLAGGIYQALTTTAFGLLIGIIAFVGYNLLVANVDKAVFNMEQSTVEFMDLLQEPSN
ncbi:MAG: MotA/TolQ/ExbB proton channel family protein [Saprospiraceae bacterium]